MKWQEKWSDEGRGNRGRRRGATESREEVVVTVFL